MEDNKSFLESLFLSAVNLYGAIFLCDLFDIYAFCRERGNYPQVTMEDMVSFANEKKNESAVYSVIPIKEIYECEMPDKKNSVISATRLILDKYNKYELVRKILEMSSDKPYFIPTSIIDYETAPLSDMEKEVETLLGDLSVTEENYVTRWKTVLPCANVGKQLKDFDFLNQDEQFKLDYISGKVKGGPKINPAKVAQYMEYHKGPENEKLIREFKWKTTTSLAYPIDAANYILDEICETGVLLSEEDRAQLTRKLLEMYNCQRLWTTRGWQPNEIRQGASETDEDVTHLIGPGAHKALWEGNIPVEKLVETIRNNGFDITSNE